jgi:hypothetical protein
MARFWARIQGNRGEATRLGTKASGIHSETNGWDIGCRVWICPNNETGEDEMIVWLTGGSNNPGLRKVLYES